MRFFLIVLFVLFSVGCGEVTDDEMNEKKEKYHLMAKDLMSKRESKAKEVSLAIQECIKSSLPPEKITASGNDQAEVVDSCTESIHKSYGIYSSYREICLVEYANNIFNSPCW